MLQQTCRDCASKFDVTDDDRIFYAKVGPVYAEKSFPFPPPGRCPACRARHRIAWRNDFTYYSRECSSCKKRIVSVHAPGKPYPVYCHNCWWGEGWDQLSYGMDYDPKRPFFEQFGELALKVPQLAMMNDNGVKSENCEYCQDFAYGKNCYLVTGSWQVRDSFYSNCINYCRDLFDCKSIYKQSELVYGSLHCEQLYACSFMEECSGCSRCHFGIDLKGCSDCIGCVGLRHKQFHIFNEPYTEAEYTAELRNLGWGSHSGVQAVKEKFKNFSLGFPRKATHQVNCEDSRGNHIFNCRGVEHVFETIGAEYSKHIVRSDSPVWCHDVWQTGKAQWCYNAITPDESYLTACSTWCWKSKNVLYSDNCHSSDHLFGCIALRRAKYCILNKQYSEKEYVELAAQIVREMIKSNTWGEFFPAELCPFGYNETLANQIYPLTPNQALKLGFFWKEEQERPATPSSYEIPDKISDVQDAIVDEPLCCDTCGRNYKILRYELDFYRKLQIPIPHNCPACRRDARFHSEPDIVLYIRQCTNCGAGTDTAYSPDRPERIVCEKCYEKLL